MPYPPAPKGRPLRLARLAERERGWGGDEARASPRPCGAGVSPTG
ncbi:MAG: hypothetical protein QME51_01265 [Planctomycetota bacterium]|nr:hypothetical protein [Planctomycetota bacterium]